ncbi:MAG: site-specific DNA-methyltransferase [Clostridia bacterium]|nr:site-specific DNA-methyltransferase [Clostridia bacterium]
MDTVPGVPEPRKRKIKCELYNDNFQNFKRYGIPKAQLVIADIPYNIGTNFYGSNPMWYKGGDNANGESRLAGKAAFNSDFNFNIVEYFHFCNRLLKKEPEKSNGRGKSSDAPCMIVFCSFQQISMLIETAKQYGFKHNIPLTFIKRNSAQALKANMRIVGATEHAVLLYRDKLPKFRNVGADGKNHMVFDWFEWQRDSKKEYAKIHPTQKPIAVLKKLIEIFTDPGDVVIDPCAGSGSTLRAAYELGRSCYGFEISRDFCRQAWAEMLPPEAET